MTLTTPESTLLSNIKLYLAKADTDLSEEGIKSLVRLTQFNTIVQRIARVAPDSLEKVIFVALDVLQAYKERQKDEKKKRALETKEADGKDLPMIKRRKLVTPDVERGRRSTNTPAVQTTDSANKASDLIKSKNSLVQNKAKTDASNNNHTLSATSHLSPEASTASRSSSVSLSPSTVSSAQSVMSTRPSAIGSTSFRDTENQSRIHVPSPTRSDDFHDTEKQSQIRVSNPIRSDDTQASRKPEQRTTTTVLNDPMNQAEGQIHQLPLQDFSSSNNDLHLLAIENPEIAIFSEDKETLQQLRSHFKKELYPGFSRSIKATKSDKDISEVLGLCPMLNFDRVQSDLLAFIILRRQRPGSRAHIIDLGENAEPIEVFQAINISGVNEADAKLHRVYGQVRLVESIDRKVKSGYVPTSHTEVNNIVEAQLPTFYLDDMAYEMCREQSPDAKKKLQNKLQREREAGMHWIGMIESMGGMGIVFVLIFAGVSRDALTTRFNHFQRDCLAHIIHQLPSLQRLIGMFHESALEDFCRDGRVSDEIEENVRAAHGPEIAFDTSDETDSEDESVSEDEIVSDENDAMSDDAEVDDHDKIANDHIVNGESMGEMEVGVDRTPESGNGGRSA